MNKYSSKIVYFTDTSLNIFKLILFLDKNLRALINNVIRNHKIFYIYINMTFYLFGAGVYCAYLLLVIFKNQQNLNITPISWLIIFIASTFWVLVIPISLLEIIIKRGASTFGRFSQIANEPLRRDFRPDETNLKFHTEMSDRSQIL
jgi:RsiW-degrading membrane proteinase PrsW (M82 family)